MHAQSLILFSLVLGVLTGDPVFFFVVLEVLLGDPVFMQIRSSPPVIHVSPLAPKCLPSMARALHARKPQPRLIILARSHDSMSGRSLRSPLLGPSRVHPWRYSQSKQKLTESVDNFLKNLRSSASLSAKPVKQQ